MRKREQREIIAVNLKDLLKSIEGMVIFVTNTASHEVESISKETEFRNQLVYVLADTNFTVK